MQKGKLFEDRRFGLLSVPVHLVDSHPGMVARMLSNIGFLPMRVDIKYERDAYHYQGWSPQFFPSAPYTVAREYEIKEGMVDTVDGAGKVDGRKLIYLTVVGLDV